MLGLGFLRLIMIASVFNFNNNEEYHYSYFFSGVIALKLFFIFSGFFMDMTFHKYKDTKSFYISRIIRIYPCYWLAAFTEFFLQKFHFNYYYLHIHPKQLKPFVAEVIQFSNLFLFGKDDIFFLSQDQKMQVHWIKTKEKSNITYYIMVFPSWSMGIMMKFYLLVPIFAKIKSLHLFIIFCILFSIRAFYYSILNMNFDPYNYRFFPFELPFFLIGQLMNRFYTKYQILYDELEYTRLPILLISIFMVLYDHFFAFLGSQFLPVLFVFLIPYLFHISKKSLLDKKIGDLVYFMYMSQTIVVSIMSKIFPKALISGSKFLVIEIICCFLFSISFDLLIQRFINKKFNPLLVDNNDCRNTVQDFNDLDNETFDIRESVHFRMVNGDKSPNNSIADMDCDSS